MNSTEVVVTTVEDEIAASLILLISGVSILVNGTTTALLLGVKNLRGTFAYLCVSHGIGDCGILLIFASFAAPMTFSQSSISLELFGKKVGQLALLFWFGYLYSTLLVALNRFFAIAHPVRYRKLFTDRNTIYSVLGCWFLAACHSILYFFDGCDFYYDPATYIWQFAATDCGAFASFYLDFIFGIICFCLIFTLNVVTAYQLRKSSNQLVDSGTHLTVAEVHERERRRKREIRFFLQSCVNGAVFNFELICFHVLTRFATDKWSLFATTSLIWQLSHASNGFVFLAFNHELRKKMFGIFFEKPTQKSSIFAVSAYEKNIVTPSTWAARKKSSTTVQALPHNNFL